VVLNSLYYTSDDQYLKQSKLINSTNVLPKISNIEIHETTLKGDSDNTSNQRILVSSLEKTFPQLIKKKKIRTTSGFNSFDEVKVIDLIGLINNILIALKEIDEKIKN
jgi:hypothetical protein